MGDEDVVQEEVLPLEPLITQVTGVPPTLPLVRHTKVWPPAQSFKRRFPKITSSFTITEKAPDRDRTGELVGILSHGPSFMTFVSVSQFHVY